MKSKLKYEINIKPNMKDKDLWQGDKKEINTQMSWSPVSIFDMCTQPSKELWKTCIKFRDTFIQEWNSSSVWRWAYMMSW